MSQTIESKISGFAKINKISLKKIDIQDFVAYLIDKTSLLPLLNFLKTDEDLKFTILTDLFGADFPNKQKRFEIVYSLLSLKLNKRIILKTQVELDEKLPSISTMYNAACWYEREAFDMFGVSFTDAKDLRRILTDYGFVGHPLRKDFPVTGHLQVKYDSKLEQVIYEPVLLEQEFRNFNFVSPWQGPKKHVLPGDEKATSD